MSAPRDRQAAVDFACPRCKAEAGKPCTDGMAVGHVHSIRAEQARAVTEHNLKAVLEQLAQERAGAAALRAALESIEDLAHEQTYRAYPPLTEAETTPAVRARLDDCTPKIALLANTALSADAGREALEAVREGIADLDESMDSDCLVCQMNPPICSFCRKRRDRLDRLRRLFGEPRP